LINKIARYRDPRVIATLCIIPRPLAVLPFTNG